MKKKITLLLLALCLSFMALAGCSAEGNEYLKLSKEIGSLPQYTYEGTLDMGFNFPESMLQDIDEEGKAALEAIRNIHATYTGYYELEKGSIYMDMEYTLPNAQVVPLRIHMQGKQILLNAQDLLTFMTTFGASEEEIAATAELLQDVQWLDLDSITSIYGDLDILNSINYVQLNNSMYAFIEQLNASSYKDYQPTIFSKKDQGYEMKLDDENIIPVINEFVTYTINHLKPIGEDFKNYIATLDDSVFALMDIEKEDMLAAIDQLAETSNAITLEDIKELQATFDEIAKELPTYLDGTEISSYVAKTGEKTYENNAHMLLTIHDPDNSAEYLQMTMDIKMNLDASQENTFAFPTEGIQSVTQLTNNKLPDHIFCYWTWQDNAVFCNKTYVASILNNSRFDTMAMNAIDGYNYLPMRQLAELFGEQVEWDQTAQKAYVVRDGVKTEMVGFVENGVTYVKLREFEKLGFTVNYDPANGGSVTITK